MRPSLPAGTFYLDAPAQEPELPATQGKKLRRRLPLLAYRGATRAAIGAGSCTCSVLSGCCCHHSPGLPRMRSAVINAASLGVLGASFTALMGGLMTGFRNPGPGVRGLS